MSTLDGDNSSSPLPSKEEMRRARELEDQKQIELLRGRGYFVSKQENRYDRHDMISRPIMMQAGAMKVAAYRLRDPETLEFGKLQFHMTYDNTVMAVLSEDSVRLLVNIADDCIGGFRFSRMARHGVIAALKEWVESRTEFFGSPNRDNVADIKLLDAAKAYFHEGA